MVKMGNQKLNFSLQPKQNNRRLDLHNATKFKKDTKYLKQFSNTEFFKINSTWNSLPRENIFKSEN